MEGVSIFASELSETIENTRPKSDRGNGTRDREGGSPGRETGVTGRKVRNFVVYIET